MIKELIIFRLEALLASCWCYLRGSSVILALNSSNANRSVSLFPPTTVVTNKPHHQRRIKACMKKEEDGGDELHWDVQYG
ncbi:hypothetical protein ACB094_11G152100 [Castanea mollissima]